MCEALALLGSGDKHQEGALLLPNIIMPAFRKSEELDCPPTAGDMQLSSERVSSPQKLIRFLDLVTAGKEDVESSIVMSIEQNICHAVSEAE